jgi:hypothetical protein
MMDVEYIDLDTGQPVPGPTESALAMPLHFSKAARKEIRALLHRRDVLARKLRDFPEFPEAGTEADSGPLLTRMTKIKEEARDLGPKLYALLIANPMITEDWLLENPDKWCPQDLAVLVRRFETRHKGGS